MKRSQYGIGERGGKAYSKSTLDRSYGGGKGIKGQDRRAGGTVNRIEEAKGAYVGSRGVCF